MAICNVTKILMKISQQQIQAKRKKSINESLFQPRKTTTNLSEMKYGTAMTEHYHHDRQNRLLRKGHQQRYLQQRPTHPTQRAVNTPSHLSICVCIAVLSKLVSITWCSCSDHHHFLRKRRRCMFRVVSRSGSRLCVYFSVVLRN